MNKVSRK